MSRFVDSIGGLANSIGDFVEEKVEGIDKPIIIDIKGIRRAGSDCYTSAKDTTELCTTTIERAQKMVNFGNDIKATLTSFQRSGGGGITADTFATIQDLVDGDQVKEATALAADLDILALKCVDKSVDMIDAMERGVDALPDVIEARVENKMEAAAEKGALEGDPEMPHVDKDVKDLEGCIDEINHVTLFTVMKSGVDAFTSLASKGALIKSMFATIKDFAESVTQVTEAIKNYQVGGMMGKWRDLVKDLWRCLRLSSLIKAFAVAIGNLIKWIIQLFQKASEKLGQIWKALAHAKDVMADCIQYVKECLHLCDNAKDRSAELITTTGEIQGHLENITSLRQSTLSSITDLADGDEIRKVIEIATTLDDILLACIKAIITMVKKVMEGVKNLPAVLTEGIPENAGKSENDPAPPNVNSDVENLNKCRGDIEQANAVGIISASTNGIAKVKDEFAVCQDMVIRSRGFASDCNGTIESFLGVWDLNTAMENLLQMYRLANLGEMIQQWAAETMKLVKANIAVIMAARDKIKNIDIGACIPDEIEEQMQEIAAGCCRIL